ncbi:MAG: TetR family transcriptional regulator [Gammaproteobacteria bacterium]|nr:TetR family transcriptional regulator [Gammaproteobacteria bacterium]
MKAGTAAARAQNGASRRPGRPGPQVTEKDQMRDAILDVAEQLFSEAGYSATSFRDIASQADVNPALISYYFGTKRSLYEAVFKRRGSELTERWRELLDAMEARPGNPPTVEEILRAFFAPQFEMKNSGPGGQAFIRLQTRLHAEPEEGAFALRREVYDTMGKRFIAALERALPHVTEADINWRFIFIIGAGLYMTADVDRLGDLSSGRYYTQDLDEVLERLMSFCRSGIVGPPTDLPSRSRKSSGKRKSTPRGQGRSSRAKQGAAHTKGKPPPRG